MSRIMLINEARKEEVRAAILENGILEELDIETQNSNLKKGNIYRGYVTTVEPSLNACFVNYGGPRDGFLPFDEFSKAYFQKPTKNKQGKGLKIEDVAKKGLTIPVQVYREEIGNKGAGLTTNLSLAGRFLVFLPNSDLRGISRKLHPRDREDLRAVIEKLRIPKDTGVIVRTSAVGQTKKEMAEDLAQLSRLWKIIQKKLDKGTKPTLLHHDRNLVLRSLRDLYTDKVGEIWVDTQDAYEEAEDNLKIISSKHDTKLKFYSERTPIFTKFNVEEQIETISQKRVSLPSGGSIVIDTTEALTAVDVNSGSLTELEDLEGTAKRTNKEAAQEIARQLRLRDHGGIIVIDFIDMRRKGNIRDVEKNMRLSMKKDRARHKVGRMLQNCLMVITRQRVKQSLMLQKMQPCPTCKGSGQVRSFDTAWLTMLRRIETEATSGNIDEIQVSFHPRVADYIQNSKRSDILGLEHEFNIRVAIIADPSYAIGDESIALNLRTNITDGSSKKAGRRSSHRPANKQKSGPLAKVNAAKKETDRPPKGATKGQQQPAKPLTEKPLSANQLSHRSTQRIPRKTAPPQDKAIEPSKPGEFRLSKHSPVVKDPWIAGHISLKQPPPSIVELDLESPHDKILRILPSQTEQN